MIEIGECTEQCTMLYAVECGTNEQANSKFVRSFVFCVYVQKECEIKRVTKALYFYLILSALHQFNSCILARVVFPMFFQLCIELPHIWACKHTAFQFMTPRWRQPTHMREKNIFIARQKKGKQFSNWHINYVYFADAPIFIECDQI